MDAWLLHEVPGAYEMGEIDLPEPAPGEVRVRLKVSALNHLDLWVAMGLPAPPSLPHISGGDGAGVVEMVGEGVDPNMLDTEVVVNPSLSCGVCGRCLEGDTTSCASFGVLGEVRAGTLAEAIVLPAGNVVPKPPNLSWEEAGAYALTTGTAYRMLTRSSLEAGDVLLVVGVGGGVASAAVGLGVAMGARVYVTSRSGDKIATAVQMGALAGFDSEAEFSRDIRAFEEGADVVIETVGATTWSQSLRSLVSGGRLAVCGATSGGKVSLSLPHLFLRQNEIIGSSMFNPAEFDAVTTLVADGSVPVVIDKVFDFDDLPSALERLGGDAGFGKVVVRH